MEDIPPENIEPTEVVELEEELSVSLWSEGLSHKQRAFVEEYVKDWNATKAAERAGYSAKTANEQGSQNLAKLSIQKALKLYMAGRVMSTEEATDNLTMWGRGSLAPFLFAGEIDLDSPSARENIRLLKKVKQVKTVRRGEDFTSETTRTEIEIHDPMTASIKILEMDGKFVKKIEHSGPGGNAISIDDVSNLSNEQLRDRIAATRNRIAAITTGGGSANAGQEQPE
ncbi:terminase small subunit [Larkinella terrae]|uniref:Terminase small subunit n=1 Tax=Larkinella terrae TaxID=2025311 RepID=A0A7K0EEH2_9BACT|nr:terminase small subunit [Larkinella terrae]MRS59856.1 hypothetical protein [Larkinella terrae]